MQFHLKVIRLNFNVKGLKKEGYVNCYENGLKFLSFKTVLFATLTHMRLQHQEVEIIKEAILRLDPRARVFLFGSRVDPTRKGGDIDLLILSQCLKDIDSLKILKRI